MPRKIAVTLVSLGLVAAAATVVLRRAKEPSHRIAVPATGSTSGGPSGVREPEPKAPVTSSATPSSTTSAAAHATTPLPPLPLRADCPPDGVLYGPWALRFDEGHAVVRWDACRPTKAAITLVSERGGDTSTVEGRYLEADVHARYDEEPRVAPDRAAHLFTGEVALKGLEPGTCYRYELVEATARKGRVCTARRPGEPFVFLALGDTNASKGETAKLLRTVLDGSVFGQVPDFSLHLGDMQYYDQVVESYASWFPVMQPLLAAGALQPSIGNHEFERTREFEDYYVRLFGGAGFDGPLEYYRFQSGGVWFFALDSELDMGADSPQGKWLLEKLADAASKPDYRGSIVYFHKPWITLSVYPNAPDLRAAFRPAFQRHGVKLVLQGHVHGYERFDDEGVTYLVSGGGGAALHALDESVATRPAEARARKTRAQRHHGTLVRVSAKELEVRVVATGGQTLDAFTIPFDGR